MILVGRAGLEPATYGLKDESPAAPARADAQSCDERGISEAMTLAPASTNGTETMVTLPGAPTQMAAGLLRRELQQLEAGDVVGARAVLEELLAALDGGP
jgi:hypothetical protein